MFDVGLLILGGSRTIIEQQLKNFLLETTKSVNKRLYIKIDLLQQNELEELIPIVYSKASIIAPDIDLRVLLNRKKQLIVSLNKFLNVLIGSERH